VRFVAAIGAFAAGLLLLAPTAFAQLPSSGLGEAGGVQGTVGGGGAGGGVAGGTLPFTGLDLIFLVAGGLALLVVGLGLRRVSKASR
jgi:hypothetical protein